MAYESILRQQEWLPREKRKHAPRRHAMRKNASDLRAKSFKWLMPVLLLLMIFSLLVFLTAWFAIETDKYFSIKTVRIEAQLIDSRAHEVEQRLMPYVNMNLFNIDLGVAKQSLLELSWIRDVSLKRKWPNIVVVSLREQLPVGRWNETRYVNDAADIFDAATNDFSNDLPEFYGPDDSTYQVLSFYSGIASLMHSEGLGLKALFLNQRGAWRLITQSGIEIKLGKHEPEQRLKRFLIAYEGSLFSKAKEIGVVDLRHSNGFTVKWAEHLNVSGQPLTQALQGGNQDV